MPGSSCKNTVVYKKKQKLCKSTATAFSEKKLRNKGKTFCHERRKKGKTHGGKIEGLQVPPVLVPKNTIVSRKNNLHKHCKGTMSLPYPE